MLTSFSYRGILDMNMRIPQPTTNTHFDMSQYLEESNAYD